MRIEILHPATGKEINIWVFGRKQKYCCSKITGCGQIAGSPDRCELFGKSLERKAGFAIRCPECLAAEKAYKKKMEE